MEPVTGKITLPDNDAYMEPLACVTAAASIVYIPVSVTVMEMHACFLLHHFAFFCFFFVVVVVDDDDNSPSAICNIYSLNNEVPTSKISMN
jgi:hypothetical protein